MAEKKIVTTSGKAAWWIVVIEGIIIAVLILSGFKTINPYLLLFLIVLIAAIVYYYLRKPRAYDVYRILDEWKKQHYVKFNSFLDTRNFQVIPIAPALFYIHLPFEGMMAYFDNGKITGIENNHVYRVLKRNEKSGRISDLIKHLGHEAKVEQAAEALNIDVGK